MRNGIRGLAFATLLAATTILSFGVAAQQVPPQIQPPAGEKLLQVHAKGDQDPATGARPSNFQIQICSFSRLIDSRAGGLPHDR